MTKELRTCAEQLESWSMAYFPDLSPYAYLKGQSDADALNVGWIDAHHTYRRGEVDTTIIEKLLRRCRSGAVNRTRGWHHCPFCAAYPVKMLVDGEEVVLGDAEIRVNGPGNTVFAAPTLVCHYMAAHGYRPPDGFLSALHAS